MPSERRSRRRPSLPSVAIPLLFVAVAVVGLLRQRTLLVHQCVAEGSPAGWLGLRLALLRAEVDCPTGTVALGADGRQVVGVVAVIALPVFLTHLASLGAGVGLVAILRRAFRAVSEIARWVTPRLPVVLLPTALSEALPVRAPLVLLHERIIVAACAGRAPPVACVV